MDWQQILDDHIFDFFWWFTSWFCYLNITIFFQKFNKTFTRDQWKVGTSCHTGPWLVYVLWSLTFRWHPQSKWLFLSFNSFSRVIFSFGSDVNLLFDRSKFVSAYKSIYQSLPDRGFILTLRFVVNSGWTLSIALFERSISHKMVFLS